MIQPGEFHSALILKLKFWNTNAVCGEKRHDFYFKDAQKHVLLLLDCAGSESDSRLGSL